MILTEFLEWEEQQAERHEFYRGETFSMAGETARHNRVVLNLASLIGDHLDGTPCQVFAVSMKVQIADAVLYPDVMVTCAKADAGDEQTVTAPKLIIEVLSPGVRGCYDQQNKFILYQELASLREYVLVDLVKRQVDAFTLATGAWFPADHSQAGVLLLSSIDCKLPMESVFKGVQRFLV